MVGFSPLPPPFDVVLPVNGLSNTVRNQFLTSGSSFKGDQFSINGTTGMDNRFCRNVSDNVPPRLLIQVSSPASVSSKIFTFEV